MKTSIDMKHRCTRPIPRFSFGAGQSYRYTVTNTCKKFTFTMVQLDNVHTNTYIFSPWILSLLYIKHWRILARTIRINQVIYDPFDGWFYLISGGPNNHKLVINSPDLPNLCVKISFYPQPHILVKINDSCGVEVPITGFSPLCIRNWENGTRVNYQW